MNDRQPSRKRSLATRALLKLWRLATDRSYRNMLWLVRRRPSGLFQPFYTTRADRYPVIFQFVQTQLGADSDARILSFGCSTGEEVFSLRGYFPRAAIKGIDINAANIAVCRKRAARQNDGNLRFEVAGSTAAEADATYDAIFCMAVLRHGGLGGATRCDHLLRFDDFAATVADFSRCLKAGGLLVIRYSNFRLCDAPAGAGFDAILKVPLAGGRKSPIFGPDNRLLSGVDYPDTVFRKKLPQ